MFRSKRVIFLRFALLLLFALSFSVYAVEFKVQRGATTVSGTGATLTVGNGDFDAVSSLAKAFVRITNSQHTGAGDDDKGGNQNADDVTTTIVFDSVSQISIARYGASSNTRVCWEIVEYIGAAGGDNEIVVRDQGIHEFAAAGLSETETFTGASATTDLVAFVSGVASSDTGRGDYGTGLVTTSFDDASTVRFLRGDSAGVVIRVSYAVVDFIGANWSIQRVEHNYSAAGAVETKNITAIVPTNSFLHTQKRNVGGLNGIDEFGHQVWIPSSTQVSFQLRSGASSPTDQYAVAWVVSNPQMTVQRDNGTFPISTIEPWTATLSISPPVSDLSNSSIFMNNDCSGTGTAFPRPMVATRLTAVDTIEVWRSDAGQEQAARYEVVQWPQEPPDLFQIDGTVYSDEGKTTPVSAGKTVALSVNGAAASTTTTNGSGQFTFNTAVSANDVLLCYLKTVATTWQAYHALYTSASGTNITEGNGGGTDLPATEMLDQSDGSGTGVDIAINWLNYSGNSTRNRDKDPAGGTDADATFNGKINLDRNYSYYSGAAGTDFLTVNFSNLDTNRKYTVALYNSAGANSQFRTQFQLSGVTSATNASSAGVNVTDNLTVDFSVDNTTNGYIAKWTDIDPAGTTFTITLSAYGNTDGVSPQAIMLEMQPETGNNASLVTVTDGTTELIGADALEMVLGKVVLEHQTGSSISNAQLGVIDQVDPGDEDGITISGSDATFATGWEAWVSSGANFAPGGDVDCEDIHISGTMTAAGTETFTITGDWSNDGNLVAANSTTIFSGAGAANINGNTTFYNLNCLTPSKTITVEQGVTLTVSGKFRFDGGALGTRLVLNSSGGGGTNWNLVLNGVHDVRYVNVQGSTVSGTAFLPISPPGYLDTGGNTNWYDPALPREMIFYENFETSTLASSPPNKETSYWTMTGAGGWLTEDSVVVNNLNHTTGGSQSTYSRGGAAGEGVGNWNNPAWGPITNGVAEAWFYDDMQSPKMQWIAEDNDAGNQWVGVLVDTSRSVDKYVYYSNPPGTYSVSYIDRREGWHQVKWIRTSTETSLYLDNVKLFTTTAVSDFSDFDFGTWTWHNTTGSTEMWFDDFMVYRSQHQEDYRWYANDDAQNPSSLAALNTGISRDVDVPARLRVQLQNDESQTWSGAYIGLQYREGTNGSWIDINSGPDWTYYNGLGTDKTQVTNALLTGTDVRELFVESQPSGASLTLDTDEIGEWDFCVAPTSDATIGATYYFRVVVTDSSGNFLKEMASYQNTPECDVTSSTMWVWLGGTNDNWDQGSNWNQGVPPNSTSDVIIQSSASRDCQINISGAVCKSLVVQPGRSLLLDSNSTDLTVTENIVIQGTVTHSSDSATLNLTSGELQIDGGNYNHTGAGVINASNADLRVVTAGGAFNFSGTGTINCRKIILDNFGFFSDSGSAGTVNVQDVEMGLNGQFRSTVAATAYNISGNFTNNGSMSGTTGGQFNFTGTDKIFSGTSVTHILGAANFTGTYTIDTDEDINVLNNLDIQGGAILTADTNNLLVGGNWTNSGTFNHGGGTVIMNGTGAQNVTTGGSNWNTLTVTNASAAGVTFVDGFTAASLRNTTPGSTMNFKAKQSAADNYVITGPGGLVLTGNATQNVILRRSGGSGSDQWFINPTGGSWNVDYVDVADSFNLDPTAILPTNYVDSGNTTNWFVQDQDRDGNELPDWWEYSYFGSTGNNPGADPDTDDLSTFEEYVIETNPTVANVDILYVDDDANYGGDGSQLTPFKYLQDALDAATDKTFIKMAEGVYSLSNYTLDKNVVIKGAGAGKTIVKGPIPVGATSDDGQFLKITAERFVLSDLTTRLYKDEQPVISYEVADEKQIMVFQNLIMEGNSTGSKSLIAPTGTQGSAKNQLFLVNSLMYGNTAAAVADLRGIPTKSYHNTIVDNTANGLVVSGTGDTFITNNILRGNLTEIINNGTGTLTVSNSNVEGGWPGAINSYDAPENFITGDIGKYRIVGAPGKDAGLTTFLTYDQDGKTRPFGPAVDVGAFEVPNVGNPSIDDTDADGLTDAEELTLGTTSTDPDTDRDGLTDYVEHNTKVKLPFMDGREVKTNPLLKDSDGDLVEDGMEPKVGMDPSVYDGICVIDLFDESFESTVRYPEGPWSNSLWGAVCTSYNGDIDVSTVGEAAAYDGSRVVIGKGRTPESYAISMVQRNGLEDYWIYFSMKMPRAKLPTKVEEAMNVASCYMAIDENGFLCAYDGQKENWIRDSETIPEDQWVTITVHRSHTPKTVNIWVNGRAAFSDVPISGINLDNYIRYSFSSVGGQDTWLDKLVGLPYSPF